ncbi:ubiquitin-protein ligase [Lactarius indigo]|nr:ubiquitin-protein ligase [Lactarius indigo]
MDLSHSNSQQAISASFPQSTQTDPQLPPSSLQSTSIPSDSSRTLRSSTRAKAPKQKVAKDNNISDQTTSTPAESSSSRQTPRSTFHLRNDSPLMLTVDYPFPLHRGRRTTYPVTAPPLTINEPTRDTKGKKRAAAEAPSEDLSASAPPGPSKRPRSATTAYALRSRSDAIQSSRSSSGSMLRPIFRQSSTTKGKAAAAKSKAMAAPGPSRVEDEDVEMMDVEYKHEASDHDDQMDLAHDDRDGGGDEDGDENAGGGPAGDGAGEEDGVGMINGVGGLPRGFAGLDESAAMAIFADYRQLGTYMSGLSSRLKTMLNNIKASADPTTRVVTLQELSELLSISTEDTLAGSFQVDAFVRELVKILGGTGNAADDDDGDDDDESHEQDEDAQLAAALALSGGGQYQGDDNLEAQVLAARCLANLMEALPGVAHTVVYHGAIPVLCSKLIEISYIDLAEQTLSTLEKISEEFPSSIVRENGLAALLNYLDFFSIAVQRTALQAASNCCRNVPPEHFQMIRSVWPIIRNCLGYSDQRLVEFACLCVIRVIDSYYRSSPENLEILVDAELIAAVNVLLLPAGGSPLIAANTFTQLLRALATSARASPNITIVLLEAGIVDTLYQILTGVLPSSQSESEEQGDAPSGQGLGGGLADMTVMQNLAHRPKDQVEEALSLIAELLPPLPKDGVYDHKAYTEKSLARMMKAKAKADRAAARQAQHAQLYAFAGVSTPSSSSATATPAPASGTATPTPADSPHEGDEPPSSTKESPPDRTEMLRGKPEVVGRFMQLIVPILVDVYAASVITTVRIKTLTGLLKAISYLEADEIKRVLTSVPVASFSSSILSSKDHPTLVIGALQLVELLLSKIPEEYRPAFRREGVFHEVELLADRTLISSKKKSTNNDKEKDKDLSDTSSAPDLPPPPIPVSPAVAAGIPGFKKLSSLSLDPEDAVTLRARVIRFRYLTGRESNDADNVFATLRRLVERISDSSASEKEVGNALKELATLFTSAHTSVSSFELLQSGVIDGLLQFATDKARNISIARRQELLLDAFIVRKSKVLAGSQTPFAIFVKKLQESLTRMEAFDVVTVTQGMDDSKRSSSPSLLARQLRLRLVAAEGSDIPKNFNNIVVSIHAIATFQALHDYLRPRVSGLMFSGSRLSGMLAALAGVTSGGLSATKPPDQPEASTSAGPSATVERRRSQRLSAKSAAAASESVPEPPAVEAGPSNPPPASLGSSAEPPTSAAGEDYRTEATDRQVFDDEIDPDNASAEKTVTLSVADDGSKVEAQTPEGTRVGTPSAVPGSSKGSLSHLTIYGAIHQHELRKKKAGPGSALPPHLLWQGVYTIKFKKVPGPTGGSSETSEPIARSRSPTPSLILRLLRVLHKLNVVEAERQNHPNRSLPESAFVNNKLSAKLTRQLEEPMIVASQCLPDWALDLPQHFPFLFPFATRYNFLQSTSFGYARLILKWQSQQNRFQDGSRRDDGVGFLGRLQRQKVRISRKHILESAMKVFELYGFVEYFEEVGTGLGPTLEFYALVSREFARRDLKIWRDDDPLRTGAYVFHPRGTDIANDGDPKRTHIIRVIGQFVAKAMLDSRIIDMSFNKVFLKLTLGEDVPLTIDSLKLVDEDLAKSLEKLRSLTSSTKPLDKLQKLLKEKVDVEDLALDFTIPGYDIELRPNGRNITVTSENVEEYIAEVIEAIIGEGAKLQAKAFREGFSKVFPITDLQAFALDELVMLFGNGDEDWSIETLNEAIKADHGFNAESRTIRSLIEVMSGFETPTRRQYLQFLTGSPRLPIGGFRGLNPPLTVVRKPHEAPLKADDYLPSVMTCLKDVMLEKLQVAMKEGIGSFHLS